MVTMPRGERSITIAEAVVADLQREVFGHLVGIDDGTDSETNLGLAAQWCMAPANLGGNARQITLGGCQQVLALAGAFAGQIGIAANNQPFARIIGGGDLGEIALIEQRQLQWTRLGEFLDLRCAQAGDPIEAGWLDVLANARRGDHAAITDQNHMLETEALLQLVDPCCQRAGIAGIPLEHLNSDRPAIAITQQAVHDLRPVRAVIAAVAILRQFAAAAFQIG